MRRYIQNHIEESIKTKERILQNSILMQNIFNVTEVIIDAYKDGKKTLIAGNGGSAADAQHIAAEFVGRFHFDRPALASIALTTDTSILTAIGNDYGFDRVFARQIEANGNSGDVFIAISTSGNSANIIEALKVCKDKDIISVGLSGESGGKMAEFCDYMIKVPSNITPRIQESHILIAHIICATVEEALFGESFK